MEGIVCDECEKVCNKPKIKLKVYHKGGSFMCYSYYGTEKHFCKYTCAMAWLGRERDKI